jgi:hypothetical protein
VALTVSSWSTVVGNKEVVSVVPELAVVEALIVDSAAAIVVLGPAVVDEALLVVDSFVAVVVLAPSVVDGLCAEATPTDMKGVAISAIPNTMRFSLE